MLIRPAEWPVNRQPWLVYGVVSPTTLPAVSASFSRLDPPNTQALAGSPSESVLDEPSKSSRRRLSWNDNATTPIAGLRSFFKRSDNEKLSSNESKFNTKPKWTKLTEWMLDSST